MGQSAIHKVLLRPACTQVVTMCLQVVSAVVVFSGVAIPKIKSRYANFKLLPLFIVFTVNKYKNI